MKDVCCIRGAYGIIKSMKNIWYVVGIIAVVVFAVGYAVNGSVLWFAMAPPISIRQGHVPTPAETHKTVTMEETSSEFSPAMITIKAGYTVTFVNNSSGNIRVSSDPHPTHTGYPTTGGCVGSTFDSCAPIASGASWSFTFGSKGSWGYHNHFSPSQRGTVVVE